MTISVAQQAAALAQAAALGLAVGLLYDLFRVLRVRVALPLLAAVVFLEAGNQSAEGQQAVVEVVFNRVLHSAFPDTVHDVLHQGEGSDVPQFSTIYAVSTATPTQAQYDAINGALYGDTILDADVVFFSRNGENGRVWGQIGDHIFCREYIWG